MRINNTTIPSKFIRQDGTITAADEFVNVHDMQTVRKNHNILVARGMMRTVLSQQLNDGYDGTESFILAGTVGQTDPMQTPIVLQVPIFLTQNTRQCKLVVRASTSRAGQDIYLYPIIHKTGDPPYLDKTNEVTVTGTSLAWYTQDVNVPYVSGEDFSGSTSYYLTLLGEPEIGAFIDASPAKSGSTAARLPFVGSLESQREYNVIRALDAVITGLTGISAVTDLIGMIIYFDDGAIPPRVILDVQDDPSDALYSFIVSDRAWGTPPDIAGGDLWGVRDVSFLKMGFVGLYEQDVTTFDDEWGSI